MRFVICTLSLCVIFKGKNVCMCIMYISVYTCVKYGIRQNRSLIFNYEVMSLKKLENNAILYFAIFFNKVLSTITCELARIDRCAIVSGTLS